MEKTSQEIEILLQQASNGNAQAQCELGEYFEAKDNERSAYWYQQAAAQHHLEAMYSLAYMYEYGLGVPQDNAKALELYFHCAEQQNTEDPELAFCACKDIATFYEEGKAIQKNIETAVEWYELAAEGGVLNPEDCQHVAILYEKGEGLSVDYVKAAQWYLMAEDYAKLVELYQGPLGDDGKARYYASKRDAERYPTMSNVLAGRQVQLNYQQIQLDFQNYYQNQYPTDLQYIYSLEFNEDTQILSARSGDLSIDMARRMFEVLGDNIYYFSLAVYFQSLLPQVVGEILGTDCMNDLYRCTGWPRLCCGMYGMVNPIQLLRESMLCPSDEERDDYLFVFGKVKQTILNDFLDFLEGDQPNLNQEAYDRVVEAAYPYMWELEQECNIQCGIYRMWLNDSSLSFKEELVAPEKHSCHE